MAKKKQRVSNLELMIWKSIGLLLSITWIIAVTFTAVLINQYGLWGAGFIAFYIYLALIPVSYLLLYILVLRLKPQGNWYGAAMLILVVSLIPLTFLLSAFATMLVQIDAKLVFILFGVILAFLLSLLHKKIRS